MLNFIVELRDAYCDGKPVKGYHFIVRTDTGHILGSCRSKYEPVQNTVLFDIINSFSEYGGGEISTGILNSGGIVYAMQKLTKAYSINNIDHYLFVANSHNGNVKLQMGILPFRLSCSNMLPRIGKYMFRAKHTKSVMGNIDNFKEKIRNTLENFPNYKELQRVPCRDPNQYFQEIIKTERALEKILEYYQSDTVDFGNWFGAYNAINSYLNHSYGRNKNTRLRSLLFGKNDEISIKALNLAQEYAKNG